VRRTLTAWGETPPLDENEREWARLLRLSEQGWIRMHIGQGTRQVEILKPLIGKFHSLEPGRSHSDLLEPLLARGESVRLNLGQQVSLTLDAGETSADLEALFGDGEIELSEVPQQSEQRVRMCCGDTTVLLVGHLEYFRLRQMLVLRFSSPGGTVFLEWHLPTNLKGAQLKFWTLPIAQRSDLRPEDKPYLRALGMMAHSSAVRLEWTPTGRGSIKLRLEDFEVPGHLQVYRLLADSLEVEQILLERSWIEQDLEFPDLDDVAALMRWSVTLRQLNIFLKGEPAGVWTVDMEVAYLREGLTRDRWGHTTAPFRTIDVLHDASGQPWLLRTLDWAGGRVLLRRVGDTEYLPHHFVPCEDDFPLELRLEGEAKLTFAPLNEDMGGISMTSTF